MRNQEMISKRVLDDVTNANRYGVDAIPDVEEEREI